MSVTRCRCGHTVLVGVVAALILQACGSGTDESNPQQRLASQGTEKHLYYFTWSDYVDEPLLKAFEKQSGIKVVVDTFSSNEEMLAKIQGGVTGYDVAVPSDFMVSIMARQGLLAELDLARIPNVALLEPFLLGLPFDVDGSHSVPYFWGTVGIGYDSAVVKEAPDSWQILWDPRYKGKISILNDQREVLGMALRAMGHTMNTKDPLLIEAAKEKLIQQKPLVKAYTSDAFDQMLVAGDVVLAHAWGGPIARAMRERESIQYAVPREGGTIWTDCLVILNSSTRQELAHEFINYLLDTDVALQTSTRLLFASSNRMVRERLPPRIRENPAVYPPQEVIARMEWITPVDEAIRYYDQAWTELKVY